MNTRKIVVCAVLFLTASALLLHAAAENAEKPKKELVRIGVFDSRGVAIAYAHSSRFIDELKSKRAEMEKAKAAGDQEKIKLLEQWGQQGQEKLHKQGFGTASVSEYLKLVEKEIPAVAKQAGVDVIVSKWDIAYQDESVQFVDVTTAIARLFKPQEEAFKSIEALKNVKPLSEKELENIRD
jgi:hypothetical protein